MKKLLTTLLLIVATTAIAQIKVQGVVKDSIGNPLELANVIAINKATKALDSYGITNDKGQYKLDLKANATYSIQASYIGMKTSDEEIATKETSMTKDIVLRADQSLDAVELTYEMPVTVKGDTLVYNADSFNKGTERKLEDVLENLPGVQVTEDGEIEVEGKKVSKVMVEGKDFFDGDSKLATKNIPANAVDKVQVLKNYSNVNQLKGVTNNQDNIAINIKLKEGKKRFWFGNITAGGGAADNNGLYLFQPKLFFYSPDYSINVIGDMNNVGEIAFSRRDYFNFSGGFQMPSRQSGTNINLGNNNLGFLSLQNNRAKQINTKFAATNFSWAVKPTLDLSGFLIFSNTKNELQTNNDNNFTIPIGTDINGNDLFNEKTTSNTTQRSDLGMLKLSASYKPNANNQLDYDVVGRMSKETQDQRYFSSINKGVNQQEETSPYSVNQNLNYYYTLNEDNIFAFEVQHLLQDEDPFYNAIIESKDNYDSTAENLGLDMSQIGYNLAQEKRVKSNQVDAKLDYWNVLNTKSDINFTLGTIYSKQNFDSRLFQFLDNNSQLQAAPLGNQDLAANAIDYNFSDIYLGAHYRLKAGKFTITPGFSVHAYGSNNNQFGTETSDNFFRFLPDLNVRLQLKKSENLNLNYRMQTDFTDVTNFAQGFVMNNYNSYFAGNPLLENATSHNVNLSYFSFNMFNYTNVFATLNYSKRIDQIRNRILGNVIRINSPFNSGLEDETFSATGRIQKTVKKIRGTARASFIYSKFNQFLGNQVSVNENYTQNYNASIRTNFREAPNVEIGYKYTIQDNDQNTRRTKFFTKAPSIEFDAYMFKSLTFITSYTYNNFSDDANTIDNSFDFWDASLRYRKNRDSKWEYEIKATNLLNTKSQTTSTSGNIAIINSEYFIQPRFVSFRLRYEL